MATPEEKVIRLTAKGYENFTGRMGSITFTDGVSDYCVSPQQADTFGITVTCEYIAVADLTPAPVVK